MPGKIKGKGREGRESLQTVILGGKQDWEERASDHSADPAKSWPTQLVAPGKRAPSREAPHWAETARSWHSDHALSFAGACLGRAGIVASARELGCDLKALTAGNCQLTELQTSSFLKEVLSSHLHSYCSLQKVK